MEEAKKDQVLIRIGLEQDAVLQITVRRWPSLQIPNNDDINILAFCALVYQKAAVP